MSAELIEKIVTKIFIIENDLAQIKKWLENGTDKDAEFLAEMNATNQEPQGEYIATMIVEAPPSIPDAEDLANVAPVEELKKRLGLEQQTPTDTTTETPKFWQRLTWELVTTEDERYTKIVVWIIEKGGTKEQLEKFQTDKKLRFDAKVFDHLRNLIWYRVELLKGKEGAFDLKSILNQNDTTEAEKVLWEELGKTLK